MLTPVHAAPQRPPGVETGHGAGIWALHRPSLNAWACWAAIRRTLFGNPRILHLMKDS